MRTYLCDVCKVEGIIVESKRLWRFRHRIEGTIRVDVCETHRDWGKDKTYTQAGQLLIDIEVGKGTIPFAPSFDRPPRIQEAKVGKPS